jgi:hypothetical protein
MPAQPLVIEDPLDVAARLSKLGLTVTDLAEAVKIGYLGRSTCTDNDPPSLPGVILWGHTTRGLREQLMPKRWEKSDAGNYSTVISPDHTIAIVVATGDDGTGKASRSPKTSYPKGSATVAAVAVNRAQLDLFNANSTERQGGLMTWVLLVAHEAGYGVRSELSLPFEIGDDFRIEAWRERIILPPLEDDGGEAARRDAQPGPTFDVDVIRRIG